MRDRGCLGYLWYRLDDPACEPGGDVLQEVESFWGLVDAEGRPKQSFQAFRDAVRAETAAE